MDGWIGNHGRHHSLDGAGRVVWHASSRGTTSVNETGILPNVAPQRVTLSTDVDPHNPDLIDALIASIIRVYRGVVVQAPRAASGVVNPGH